MKCRVRVVACDHSSKYLRIIEEPKNRRERRIKKLKKRS
jgi:hypothetical protein